MAIETDTGGGRSVGSHITLSGKILGIILSVECVVLQRDAPRLKQWETVGEPRLLVIGGYRMSVTVEPCPSGTSITVAIDYGLPREGVQRLLGRIFGERYARWCVRQMAHDLVVRFGSNVRATRV